MLVDKKRIEMTIDISDWVDQALDDPGIQFCPITPDIAIKAQDYQEDFMEIP